MTIREVNPKNQNGPAAPAPAQGAPVAPAQLEVPKPVADALRKHDLIPDGMHKSDAVLRLLGALEKGGFRSPAAQDPFAQLTFGIRAFQSQNKLKTTGRLDDATAALLNATLLAPPPEDPAEAKKKKPDGFEKQLSMAVIGKQPQRRSDVLQPGSSDPGHADTNFLDALINSLGPGGTVDGAAKSASQAPAQATAGTAAASGAAGAFGEQQTAQGRKVAETEEKQKLEMPNAQLEKGHSQGVRVTRGLQAPESKAEDRRRQDGVGDKDPTERGVQDPGAAERGNAPAMDLRGRGLTSGEQSGGALLDAASEHARGETPEDDASERDSGNAPSGDENHDDAQRGHASTGDEECPPGHYRIASLSEQAFAALEKINRDAATENRATTYTWDVTFYRPGIYAPGQKAQDLVHLVVNKATAFDAVWHEAQASLAALVRRERMDALAPSIDDIVAALRAARARDGDLAAPSLTRVQRPMGRA